MTISSLRNISVKELNDSLEKKALGIKIMKMLQIKKNVSIPIVKEAFVVIIKGVNKYLDRLPGNPNISETLEIVIIISS